MYMHAASLESERKIAEKQALEKANAKIRAMEEEMQRLDRQARQASASLAAKIHRKRRSSDDGGEHRNVTSSQAITPLSNGTFAPPPSTDTAQQTNKKVNVGSDRKMKLVKRIKVGDRNGATLVKTESQFIAQRLMCIDDPCGLSHYPFTFLPSTYDPNSHPGHSINEKVFIELNDLLQGMSTNKVSVQHFVDRVAYLLVLVSNKAFEAKAASDISTQTLGSSTENPSSNNRRVPSNGPSTSSQNRGTSYVSEKDATIVLLLKILNTTSAINHNARQYLCEIITGETFTRYKSDDERFPLMKATPKLSEKLIDRINVERLEIADNSKQNHIPHIYSEKKRKAFARIIMNELRRLLILEDSVTFARRDLSRGSTMKLQIQFQTLKLFEQLVSNISFRESPSLWKEVECIILTMPTDKDVNVTDRSNVHTMNLLEHYLRRTNRGGHLVKNLQLDSALSLISILFVMSKERVYSTKIISALGNPLIYFVVDQLEYISNYICSTFKKVLVSASCTCDVCSLKLELILGNSLIRLSRSLSESCSQVATILFARTSHKVHKSLRNSRERSGLDVIAELMTSLTSFTLSENSRISSKSEGLSDTLAPKLLKEVLLHMSSLVPYLLPQTSNDDKTPSRKSPMDDSKDLICSSLYSIFKTRHSKDATIDYATRYEARLLLDDIQEIFNRTVD